MNETALKRKRNSLKKMIDAKERQEDEIGKLSASDKFALQDLRNDLKEVEQQLAKGGVSVEDIDAPEKPTDFNQLLKELEEPTEVETKVAKGLKEEGKPTGVSEDLKKEKPVDFSQLVKDLDEPAEVATKVTKEPKKDELTEVNKELKKPTETLPEEPTETLPEEPTEISNEDDDRNWFQRTLVDPVREFRDNSRENSERVRDNREKRKQVLSEANDLISQFQSTQDPQERSRIASEYHRIASEYKEPDPSRKHAMWNLQGSEELRNHLKGSPENTPGLFPTESTEMGRKFSTPDVVTSVRAGEQEYLNSEYVQERQLGEPVPAEVEGVKLADSELHKELEFFIDSIDAKDARAEEPFGASKRGHALGHLKNIIKGRGGLGENEQEVFEQLEQAAAQGWRDPEDKQALEDLLVSRVYKPIAGGSESETTEFDEIPEGGEIPPVPDTLIQQPGTPGYWEDTPRQQSMSLQGGQPGGDELTLNPMSDSYLDPMRMEHATRMGAAASDPTRSDPMLNHRQREQIQHEKEKATQQYGEALNELMKRSQNSAMASNLVRALGKIAAGTVGLVSGLNVAKYYDPGEVTDAAEMYNQMAPMLQAKHQEEQQRYDELSAHYEEALGFYMQNVEVAKALAQFEKDHVQLNLENYRLLSNLHYKQQEMKAAGQTDQSAELQAQVKAIESAYADEISMAEDEMEEAKEGLNQFREQVNGDYESERFKDARAAIKQVNSSVAARDGNWKVARTAFSGTPFDLTRLDKLHGTYVQGGMSEEEATRQVFSDLYEFGNTNPSTYLHQAVSTGTVPAEDVENIARYNLLYNSFFSDQSNPLSSGVLDEYTTRLAEAKHVRNHYQRERSKALSKLAQGGGRRWVEGTEGTTTVIRGSANRQGVPMAPVRPVAGSPSSPEFINPEGRRDMRQYRVPGNRGNSWAGLLPGQIEDKGGRRGDTYYLPSHVTNDPEFLNGIYDIASEIGTDPEGLLGIMSLETANTFHPAVVNPSGATGLIQFMPGTARDLLDDVVGQDGQPVNFTPTQAQAYMASLPRNEQLPYVSKYFQNAKRMARISPDENLTAGQLYTLVLMGPAGSRRGWSVTSKAARQNKSIVEGALRVRKREGRENLSYISGSDVAKYFDTERMPKKFEAKQGAAPIQEPSQSDIPPSPPNLGNASEVQENT